MRFLSLLRRTPLPCALLSGALVLGLNHSQAQAATYTVTNLNDSGAGSLRQAILDANGAVGDDDISFDATVFAAPRKTIALAGTQLTISSNIAISAPTAGVVVSGNGASRVFEITNGSVSMIGLSITGGNIAGGDGSAIISFSNDTRPNSVVGNFGGGIFNKGTLLLQGCTLSGNTAQYGGGAICSQTDLSGNTLTVRNCTITGNSSLSGFGGGGAILNVNGLTVIQNSTLTGNSAPAGTGSGVATIGGNTQTVRTEVNNSIIAGNANTDVDRTYVTSFQVYQSNGFNLVGDGNAASVFNTSGDQVIGNGDPGVEALADNGGPTQTARLLSGSAAIDKGNSALSTDQRGLLRPVDFPILANASGGNGSDIGAFEVQNEAPVVADVSIDQSAPKTNDSLTFTGGTATDANGDPLTTTYQWKKNGQVINNETGVSLNLATSGNGDKNDKISVVVTVSDGLTSTSKESPQVTIANSAPVVTGATITPTNPKSNTVLTTQVGATDADADSPTYTYVWKKNGVVIVGETDSTLDLSQAGNGDNGDVITVTVTANDGTDNSAPVTSDSVTINNLSPTVDSVLPNGAVDSVGAKRTFSVTVSDGNGPGDIKEVWLLINDRLNWAEGATLIYVPSASSPTNGILYLRRGDIFLEPITVGQGASATQVLDNGAVRIVGSEVSVSVSGNSLALTLPATVRDGLVGQNKLFARVQDRDDALDTSSLQGDMGFVRFGNYSVTPQFSGANVAPVLSKLSPTTTNTILGANGISPVAHKFGFFVTDDNGIGDVESVWFLAGKQLNWSNSATFVYQPRTRRLYLRSDDGSTFLGGGQIGQAGIIENSQVRVDLSTVKATIYPDGKSFGLTLYLQAKSGLVGQNTIWLRAQDKSGAVATGSNAQGYIQSGTWNVARGSAPANAAKPSNGNS
ncbi:hypothetical protein EON83_26385 [bacterium]|nr:MAG: hypothetical protein EON83_26385 [bacterium]